MGMHVFAEFDLDKASEEFVISIVNFLSKNLRWAMLIYHTILKHPKAEGRNFCGAEFTMKVI